MTYATHCIPYDEDCVICNPDAGPTVEDMARNVAAGRWCQDCGCEFTKEHGEPVSCTTCISERIEADIREVVVRSQHPEANREAHRARAKKRKAKHV